MARQRHLSRAPITEALIDFRVVPREGLTFEALREVLDAIDGYYVKGPIVQGRFGFSVEGGQPRQTSSETTQVGMRFHSGDEKYVAQCVTGGFTLSRLPPYESWDNLRAEAARVWQIYLDRLRPTLVTTVATRFINNLHLPMNNGISYQLYVNKLVDVPEEAPQAVEAFFQQFRLVDAATGARVVLTLTHNGGATDGTLPVILDVNAFTSIDSNAAAPEIWTTLEALRQLKNRTFFGTISERAAELYE